MEILSKEIKIPSREIDSIQKGFSFLRWMDAANKSISIFYKKDDEHLLKDKWEVITLLLEREFGGVLPSQFTEMVLFVEKKRKISNVYLFFSDKNVEKSEYFKYSFESFKDNAYPDVKEDFNIDNVMRIRFKGNFFGNSCFWSVSKSSGETKDAKGNWKNRIVRKDIEDLRVLPVKFNNKNSNGLINLMEVFNALYVPKYNDEQKEFKVVTRYKILDFIVEDGYYNLGYDKFISLNLCNHVSGEQHSLQKIDEMTAKNKDFFDNMVLDWGTFSSSKGVNFITLATGENYFITLS